MMTLLQTGRFLTVVPKSALRFSKRRGIKVLPVALQHTRVPIGIITLKNRMHSPVAKLFVDSAREVARSLAKGNV